MDEKYTRLIRELIAPTNNWRHILDQSQHVPTEHREKCLEAGIKRFDELYSEGKHWKAAAMGAEAAIRRTAQKLQDKHLKELERTAPTIQAKISELIQDKEPGFDLGYQVADALKALGYTWDQVILAKRDMKLPGNVDGGIQIGYTGLYD